MKAADELAKHVGVKPACAALEVSRSTLYRRRGPSTGQQQPRPTPARALSETERGEVFDTLCSERFVDRSPAEVVATLLDEEVYLCSERTMYRVLASEVPVQERRAQRTHPEYKKPELMATAPNQVWSWDMHANCSGRRSGAITTSTSSWTSTAVYVDGLDGGGPGELGPEPAGCPRMSRMRTHTAGDAAPSVWLLDKPPNLLQSEAGLANVSRLCCATSVDMPMRSS